MVLPISHPGQIRKRLRRLASAAFNLNTTAGGSASASFGNGTLTKAETSFVIGRNNAIEVNASNSFVGGENSIAYDANSFVFGKNVVSRGENNAVFGGTVYADNFKLSKGTFGDIGKMADRINELVRVAQNLNDRVTEIELKYIGN